MNRKKEIKIRGEIHENRKSETISKNWGNQPSISVVRGICRRETWRHGGLTACLLGKNPLISGPMQLKLMFNSRSRVNSNDKSKSVVIWEEGTVIIKGHVGTAGGWIFS